MKLEVSSITKYWNRLIKKSVSVDLDSTKISVTRNGVQKHISLNDIFRIENRKEWFSNHLIITVEGQENTVLKGYSSTKLNTFIQQAIQYLLALVATSDRWQMFEQTLDKMINREIYLSSSEWLPIAQLHQLISRFNQLGINSEQFVNPLHSAVFAKAQGLSKEDVSELGRELHNQSVVPILLKKHAEFFETVEKLPLTEKQRIACVTNDDHNLVIAGAGTGKTATLVGKAGFLVEVLRAKLPSHFQPN